jgi:hypothetical protein
MAPHAMVIKQKGNSLPATTGPEPSTNWLMGGIFKFGKMKKTPSTSAKIVPNFMKVLR